MNKLKNGVKRIFRHRESPDDASELYWACQNGDVEKVKVLLATIPDQDLNCVEPNGSTPLHVASSTGRADIIRLLLHDRNCKRNLVNRHGLTAYEVACSDEIKVLFHRQKQQNRFCNDDDQMPKHTLKVTTSKEDVQYENVDEDFTSDKWLTGLSSSKAIEKNKNFLGGLRSLAQSKRFLNLAGQMMDEQLDYTTAIDDLHQFVLKHVPETNFEFETCKQLILEAYKEEKPEALLKLYTLETPLYGALTDNEFPLLFPLSINAYKLKSRFFQGTSYRGVRMKKENLRAYQWALKNRGVAAIETSTFCSTSLNRSIAEFFAESHASTIEERILMIYNFPAKCDTAINLGKLSNKLPCISKFEDEQEVLILPLTLFTVKNIVLGSNNTIIYLENIPVKKRHWFTMIKPIYSML